MSSVTQDFTGQGQQISRFASARRKPLPWWHRPTAPREARINSLRIRGAWLGMGCKAVIAANIENICKKTNAADRPSPSEREPQGINPRFPRGLPLVLEVLAIVIALSVLLAFYQVVRSAVHRGDNLALARAEQARATHHCNTLSGIGAGEACLQRLNAAASRGKGAL